MNKIAYIAILLAFLPIINATYGNGTIYSLGSATTSIQGNAGSSSNYSMEERMDYRPVALGNSTYFDIHAGFWEFPITTLPYVPPYIVRQVFHTSLLDASGDFYLIGAILAILLLGVGLLYAGKKKKEVEV